MLQLVEEMHVRLNEIAASEQALLKVLRDALNRVDHKLMQDVRVITAQHEAKRRAALDELQSLASRIGAFPSLPQPMPEIGRCVRDLKFAEHGYSAHDPRQRRTSTG